MEASKTAGTTAINWVNQPSRGAACMQWLLVTSAVAICTHTKKDEKMPKRELLLGKLDAPWREEEADDAVPVFE